MVTLHFVFQIYTGCYDGSVQAVKLNLLQNFRCRVRSGTGSRAESVMWMGFVWYIYYSVGEKSQTFQKNAPFFFCLD